MVDSAASSMRSQTFHFPEDMLDDLQALAARLKTHVGEVVWMAWEEAKSEMHTTIASTKGEQGFTVAAEANRNPKLVVPDSAPEVSALDGETEKRSVKLGLPGSVLDEIQAFATSRDQSLSWCVQRAYLLTRARLLSATRA
ncbi:MAG TPA: hypothetical protein VGC41_26400 [Kofleriaceae bacterium]